MGRSSDTHELEAFSSLLNVNNPTTQPAPRLLVRSAVRHGDQGQVQYCMCYLTKDAKRDASFLVSDLQS